jgi:uncharacterized membrane protein YagU involved in acid resistance
MTNEPSDAPPHEERTIEMPRPNVWPMVLSLGILLMAAGVATSLGFLVPGIVLFVVGLAGWIGELLPGKGHLHEPMVEPVSRSAPVTSAPGTVEQLHPGMAGYRFQLPEKVHPISAGVKGGLLGGAVMPLPALAYGLVSGKGLLYAVNLLAGMVLPGIENMTDTELGKFHLSLFVTALLIHVAMSVVFGLLYGVLLPTLPEVARPLAWGGLLAPVLWTGVSFSVMGLVNPVLAKGVNWPWFIVSQFVFGAILSGIVPRLLQRGPIMAGVAGGLAAGALMPVPAVLWSLANGHGIWYPVNLLAGMVVQGMGKLPMEEQRQFHADWLITALVIHAILSVSFAVLYAFLLPKLPRIPAALAWGGLLMPLLWTAASYSLMGVVNKALQERVDWPWFIVSQFVFGLVAAVVVLRSEKIPVPPTGLGPAS